MYIFQLVRFLTITKTDQFCGARIQKSGERIQNRGDAVQAPLKIIC